MRKSLLVFAAVCSYALAFGQSFEGKLKYLVTFDIKTQKIGDVEITEEQIIEKMKTNDEFFDTLTITLKGGNYIKEDNASLKKRMIYLAEANKIYIFQEDFEYVVITDANRFASLELDIKAPTIELLDSTKIINGISCKLLKLSWGKLGEEFYYYNSDVIKLNPDLFINHNFEYLNAILKETKSYPLEIIKTLGTFISVKMTLIEISDEKIEDSVFILPQLKKADKDYAEMMLKMTGSEVMEIK